MVRVLPRCRPSSPRSSLPLTMNISCRQELEARLREIDSQLRNSSLLKLDPEYANQLRTLRSFTAASLAAAENMISRVPSSGMKTSVPTPPSQNSKPDPTPPLRSPKPDQGAPAGITPWYHQRSATGAAPVPPAPSEIETVMPPSTRPSVSAYLSAYSGSPQTEPSPTAGLM